MLGGILSEIVHVFVSYLLKIMVTTKGYRPFSEFVATKLRKKVDNLSKLGVIFS
jgi:hypothetical protein